VRLLRTACGLANRLPHRGALSRFTRDPQTSTRGQPGAVAVGRSNAASTSSVSSSTRRRCLRLVLVGWVLVEAHDEWPVADKRYLSETTLALLGVSSDSANQSVAVPAAITA
jgi:hypothetical protein